MSHWGKEEGLNNMRRNWGGEVAEEGWLLHDPYKVKTSWEEEDFVLCGRVIVSIKLVWKWLWPIWRYYSSVCNKELSKPHRTSVKIASLQYKTEMQNLLNAKQEL
jgi:hypothetical protein